MGGGEEGRQRLGKRLEPEVEGGGEEEGRKGGLCSGDLAARRWGWGK